MSRHTVSVARPHDASGRDGHGQTRGHAPDQKTATTAGDSGQDGGLAADGVRGLSPEDGRHALGYGEDGAREAGPSCNLVLGDAKAADHFREVGVDGRVAHGLREPGNSCILVSACVCVCVCVCVGRRQ